MSRMPKVAVIGGSMIGLTAGLVLRDLGCEVDVYERSRVPLEGRGVGIVLHPMTVRYLLDNQLLDLSAVSTTAAFHRYLADDGSVLSEDARRHHFTGYNTLYGTLLRAFGPQRYHLHSELRARCTLTMSASRATSAGVALYSIPSSAARSGVRLRLQPITGMPKAWARGIIS